MSFEEIFNAYNAAYSPGSFDFNLTVTLDDEESTISQSYTQSRWGEGLYPLGETVVDYTGMSFLYSPFLLLMFTFGHWGLGDGVPAYAAGTFLRDIGANHLVEFFGKGMVQSSTGFLDYINSRLLSCYRQFMAQMWTVYTYDLRPMNVDITLVFVPYDQRISLIE